MIDYLTHYYRRGTEPFRSLSALPEAEAIQIMQGLSGDTAFGARFKDPAGYLRARRQAEAWVRAEFIARGGQPREAYPVPMVLGSSKWMLEHAPDPAVHAEIRIPLSAFAEQDVSFTYPDSMISFWFGRKKPEEYYRPEVHGRVFTLPEILMIVAARGLPEEAWEPKLPDHLAPYIEAQVWNQEPLREYKKQVWSQA